MKTFVLLPYKIIWKEKHYYLKITSSLKVKDDSPIFVLEYITGDKHKFYISFESRNLNLLIEKAEKTLSDEVSKDDCDFDVMLYFPTKQDDATTLFTNSKASQANI